MRTKNRRTRNERFPMNKPMTLAEAAWIRRNCRSCLRGVTIRTRDGRAETVHASRWNPDSRLEISIEPGGDWILASDVTVVGSWRSRCCKPLKSRLKRVLAAQEANSPSPAFACS